MNKRPYLDRIDTNTTGNRYDVTPLFADPVEFGQLVDDLAAPFRNDGIGMVAGIDALGFILGTALARELNVGLIPIRKGGKLPVDTIGEDFLDYSGEPKRLEMRRDILPPGARVLLVDEWIETGAQVRAAAVLIEAQGGTVAGIATIHMDTNDQTEELRQEHHVHSVWIP